MLSVGYILIHTNHLIYTNLLQFSVSGRFNNAVIPSFYVPVFCVFHHFTHLLHGSGLLPIRTMFARF